MAFRESSLKGLLFYLEQFISIFHRNCFKFTTSLHCMILKINVFLSPHHLT